MKIQTGDQSLVQEFGTEPVPIRTLHFASTRYGVLIVKLEIWEE
jgi:hypothetical protein